MDIHRLSGYEFVQGSRPASAECDRRIGIHRCAMRRQNCDLSRARSTSEKTAQHIRCSLFHLQNSRLHYVLILFVHNNLKKVKHPCYSKALEGFMPLITPWTNLYPLRRWISAMVAGWFVTSWNLLLVQSHWAKKIAANRQIEVATTWPMTTV